MMEKVVARSEEWHDIEIEHFLRCSALQIQAGARSISVYKSLVSIWNGSALTFGNEELELFSNESTALAWKT